MAKAKRAGEHQREPILRATDDRLAPHLLALHAAVDGESLWRAGTALLREAMPAYHYLIGLATVGTKPFMLRTTLPVPDESDYWERLNKVAPLEKVVSRFVGLKVSRMSDQVPFLLLRLTPFYRKFMKPEGWRYSAAMFFWDGDRFFGQFSQNRTAEQGDFTDAEIALLGELHPHFETAIRRVILFDRERVARRSMEISTQNSPIPTAVLNWDMSLRYHNPAAAEACAVWRLGAAAARSLKPTFELPEDIAVVCREIGEAREQSIIDKTTTEAPRRRLISHGQQPGAQATVKLLDPDGSEFSRPQFLIQFSFLPAGDNVGEPMQTLARLTPAEREVALRAAQGISNDAIAAELNISRSTVRTHLRHIFEKLEITSRSQLAPLCLPTSLVTNKT